MNNIRISKDFKLSEFECHCGEHHVALDEQLIELLQVLRMRIDLPIVIMSGYRCKAYNRTLKGASPKSQHMLGKAVDIKVRGMKPAQVAMMAEAVGFTGIGTYPTFTHIDVRPNKSRWTEADIKE